MPWLPDPTTRCLRRRDEHAGYDDGDAIRELAARSELRYWRDMRETLAASMGPIEFSDLRAHITRGTVLVVDRSLDLLDVGEAIARDDKTRVAAWVEAGLIGKPSLETIERWSKTVGPAWVSVIVQPFVLVHEGLDATSAPN